MYIYGVPGEDGIAQAINRSVKMTYKLLERGQIPGAKKIGGTWALDPEVFRAAMREPGTILRHPKSSLPPESVSAMANAAA